MDMVLGVVLLIALICAVGVIVHQKLKSQQHADQLAEVEHRLEILRALLDSNPNHIYAKSLDGRYIEFNTAFQIFTGRSADEIMHKTVEDFFGLEIQEIINEHDQQVLKANRPVIKEEWFDGDESGARLIECTKAPLKDQYGNTIGIMAMNQDMTARYIENSLLRHHSRIHDMIIRGLSLGSILREIVQGVEGICPNSACSILLLDKDKTHVKLGASSPSLPAYFVKATEEIEVKVGAGASGTAAATGEVVIIEDVTQHPYWSNYVDVSYKAGVKACWSQPIFDSQHQILGSLTVYLRDGQQFDEQWHYMLEESSRLVTLALERKQVEGDLQKLSRAVEQSPTMVLITDQNGIIEYVNEEFTEVTGYSLNEIRGQSPSVLNTGQAPKEFFKEMWDTIRDGQDWHGELRNKTKYGKPYWATLSISPILDEQGEITHYIGVSEDISNQKAAQAQIEELAFYDPLTRLGNRRLFREQVETELKKAARNNSHLALFYLDLDNFKQVNDTLGHDVGDRLLQSIADRLRSTLRHSDMIARLGGDEFIALLPDVSGPSEANVVAKKLLKALSHPETLGTNVVKATVSLGITMAPQDGDSWSVLMKNADLAMYRAKRMGRNNFQFFTPEMNSEVVIRATMEAEIKRALHEGQFSLHYQPQFSLYGELQPVCMEALIRWNHPEKGWISPGEFIPIAEELGLIVEVGAWVINEACRQAKWMEKQGYTNRVAINLSMRQFFDPGLLETIRNAMYRHDLAPERLEFEITESMIMDDANQVIETLHDLKNLGVSLSIDDFGTGYSSLSYLKKLPFDYLKVDASFVRDIPHDKSDMEITSAVIAMAHKLGLRVIAEGIETHEQLAFLRENQCEMGQGYLLARPAPVEHILSLFDVELGEVEISSESDQ
jgi:diguanylate cyclase (GGDEF)-like protein/PAS domain S-box-containing protein